MAASSTWIIQARSGSTRLPGKVLAEVAGRPMLGFMLDRLRDRLEGAQLVVATSDLDRDDAVADVADDAGVAVVRGPEADVLERFRLALEAHPAEAVVRLTADCPLIDPALVTRVIELRAETGADYACNVLPRTFPRGLDVEVLTAEALAAAAAEAAGVVWRELPLRIERLEVSCGNGFGGRGTYAADRGAAGALRAPRPRPRRRGAGR